MGLRPSTSITVLGGMSRSATVFAWEETKFGAKRTGEIVKSTNFALPAVKSAFQEANWGGEIGDLCDPIGV